MEHIDVQRTPFTGMEARHPAEGIVMGGSLAETITSAGAIVVAILALVGLFPEALLAVATIAIGGAFLMAGGAIASRFNRVLARITRTTLETGEMALGMTIEFIGGIGGIVLGVLSLLGVVPTILLPVAAILYGFTLFFGAGIQTRLYDLESRCSAVHEGVSTVVREAISATSGMRVLFGLGAFTLGIVSLVGIMPVTLTLVAMLSVGGAALFSGTALSARMWGFSSLCEQPHESLRT